MNKLSCSTPIASVALAIAGGVYFGLFSCGGYIWHRQLYWGVFGLVIALSVVFPPPSLSPILGRAVLLLLPPVLHRFALAGAAPFYPAMPTSTPQYFDQFWYAFKYGPC